MIKPFTCVCMLLAAGSGLYVYQTKHRGQMLDKEIARVLKATDAVRQRTTILRSEWAVLNEPDHLAELARSHLSLRNTATSQLAALSDLGTRLPAPLPPGTTAVLTDTEDTPALPAPALPALPAPAPVAARSTRIAAARPGAPPPASAPAPVQVAALPPPPARPASAPTQNPPTTAPLPASSPVQVAALPTPPARSTPKPAIRTAAADHARPETAPAPERGTTAATPRTPPATPALPAGATPVAAPPSSARPLITAPVVTVAAAAIPQPARPVQAAIPTAQPHPPAALGASALGGTRTALPAPVPYVAQTSR